MPSSTTWGLTLIETNMKQGKYKRRYKYRRMSLVLKESYQITVNKMVAEQKRVDRLTHKNQRAQGVSPRFTATRGGRTDSPPKKNLF